MKTKLTAALAAAKARLGPALAATKAELGPAIAATKAKLAPALAALEPRVTAVLAAMKRRPSLAFGAGVGLTILLVLVWPSSRPDPVRSLPPRAAKELEEEEVAERAEQAQAQARAEAERLALATPEPGANARVVGKVTTATGGRAAGAVLTLTRLQRPAKGKVELAPVPGSAGPQTLSLSQIVADSKGVFFRPVVPGEYELRVSDPRYPGTASQRRTVEDGELWRVDFVVAEGVELSGALFDADGQPVEYHPIELRPSGGLSSESKATITVQTAAAGRFALRVAPGTYSLEVLGWVSRTVQQSVTAPAVGVRLVMAREQRIDLTVVGGDGGALPDRAVSILGPAGGSGFRTDGQGHYPLRLLPGEKFALRGGEDGGTGQPQWFVAEPSLNELTLKLE